MRGSTVSNTVGHSERGQTGKDIQNSLRKKTYFGAPVRVPASRDMTVLFPTPCLPSTPTTKKSLCSNMYCGVRENG